MMVGRGLGGTGTVSGTGTVVVPCGHYCGDARQMVTMSSEVWVSHWYSFWLLRWRRNVSCLIFVFHPSRNNPDCSFFQVWALWPFFGGEHCSRLDWCHVSWDYSSF